MLGMNVRRQLKRDSGAKPLKRFAAPSENRIFIAVNVKLDETDV